MKIANLVRVGAGALIALLLVGGIVIGWQINAVRMGGAMQLKSKQVADLVADILPPPEYIIEPYLAASLIMIDPGVASTEAARLAELRRQYADRHGYWAKSDLPAELKQQIVAATDGPAQQFWEVLDTSFLPAAQAGDTAAMQAAYGQLRDAYAAHRQAVDRLVADSGKYQAQVEAQAGRAVSTMAVTLSLLGGVVFALVGAATFYLVRRVIAPMATLSEITTAMAAGAAPAVPYRERTDELGDIANALESFGRAGEARRHADALHLDEQRTVNDALGERLEALRHGDLTRTIDTAFPAAYERLRHNFNEAVCALRAMVHAVHDSAATIDTGAREIATAADDLARRTEASAASLEQTNAALQQVSERLRSGFEATNQTMARADQATQRVAEGRATGEDAAASMDRVLASAENIGSVIEGLDKIAFQTRVLAMNAAVEAGRAGEAGRGFAVVADLVSALALRAEEEAKRVRELITDTRADIDTAAASVQRMDHSLAEIAGDVEALHALLARLRHDSGDQTRAMAEIATTMTTLDTTTQQNAAMVEETSAAARNLSGEVSVLNAHAGAFRFERRQRDVPVPFDRRASRRSGSVARRPAGAALH